MPRYATPTDGDGAQDPLASLGSSVKVASIRYLRDHPESAITTVSEALGIGRTTVFEAIMQLEEAEIVIGVPPRESRRQGTRATFRVNDERVIELYIKLGQELGEL
jgi:ArsR family transcriptional regulator, arsenate/arsenite/antimonite-responsive transcriptional repressor